MIDLDLPDVTGFDAVERRGRLHAVRGTVLRAVVPEVSVGETCRIDRVDGRGGAALEAEVIGFDRDEVLLMPLGDMHGLVPGAEIVPTGRPATVPCGAAVRGRVLDGTGRTIDGGPPIAFDAERTPLLAPPPNPLTRSPISRRLTTGIDAIDGLLTLGRGQRIGLFAAAGVGKSTLLAQIAAQVDADTVVLALIGERGREVNDFLAGDLGRGAGRDRATVVVSTSDQPAILRLRAAYVATAIAEAARRRGEQVVMLMDSVTRFARALREIGLAAGEPPGRQGYPASVFAALPRLFERAGNDDHGSITALYTVLVAGDDLDEPVADETLGLLDGHVVLSRELASQNLYPAIDVLRSKSRLMARLAPAWQRAGAAFACRVLAHRREHADKIAMGLYEPASEIDELLLATHAEVERLVHPSRRGADALDVEATLRRWAELEERSR